MKTKLFTGKGFLVILVTSVLFFSYLFAQVKQEFENSWGYYRKRVQSGISFKERISILDRILAKYKNKGINLSSVQLERNFINSLQFYKNQVQAKRPPEELLATLQRIKQKYSNKGMNLSAIDKEINRIQARIQEQQPTAVPVQEVAPPEAAQPVEEIPEQKEVTKQEPIKQKEERQYSAEQEEFKRFGLGIKYGGGLGVLGYQGILNASQKFSFVAGYGSKKVTTSVSFLGFEASTKENESSMITLLRYGKVFYFSTGLNLKFYETILTLDNESSSVSVSNYGVPLIFGVETGKKKGFFINLEAGYVQYFGDSDEKTITLTGSGSTVTATIEPAKSEVWYGIGLGWYLF